MSTLQLGNTITTLNGTTYSVAASVYNPNNVRVTLYAKINSEDYSNIGTINAQSTTTLTLTSTLSSGIIYAYAIATNYNNSAIAQNSYEYIEQPMPQLQGLVLNSATLDDSNNLTLSYTNPNDVSVYADFYANGGSYRSENLT